MRLVRRELLALAAVAATAAAAGVFFAAFKVGDKGLAARLLAEPFTDLEGRTVRLREWSSQVLLCNFWATWCEPCREEVPLLIAAAQQFSAIGLQVVGIGVDQADKMREFARLYQVPYPLLVASAVTADLLRALGDNAAALPFSVLFDRRRRITYRKLGAWTKPQLDREIHAAIG